ncbi:nucleotidyltransferase domain-containing protein [Adlercreutzia sp. R21]|uniref:nucleotidyltransferase domain-containing protein n=1 Tax=Adlercreutzia wanghongyangiae TaxID=3111451 RepID=UPI002DB7C479|nr:nucleotidyltransferase domain-containing protein [Adlercreutzia sp. R21]MEC4184980.1 nucleotidyltransferase domain-containing protein [Adlercreutzia sp. R21]
MEVNKVLAARDLEAQGKHRLALPGDLLDLIVRGITSAIPTESIYVFGSYARGEAGPSSDIDLFVVTSDDKERPLQYATMASMKVADDIIRSGYDYDLLTRPRQQYESRRRKRTCIDGIVSREGVKIYG